MKQIFTIVIFTENKIGLLNRVTSLFTQRHINIESLTTSESEYTGIHRFTVVIHELEDKTFKIVKQIEKQVEVIKAFCFKDDETCYSEIALYKLRLDELSDMKELNQVLEANEAIIKEELGEFLIIEKTGHKEATHQLFEDLKPFGLHGFVRSGRVSLSKTYSTFSQHLQDLETHSKEIITVN
ncbi:acetolactate synthase small subunit [Fulvivirga sp. M361]|uniref:acetolactate synthase small subunit n=1 Tax=Fulvivirga sp. M361 TaxID=2594266 RepID=UPI00117A295B|nr:acetolactate synthase small subunit [Fulvivirga sp. M361]TRX61810.1 acetolactate synthase small subunit [Fulvivirga sp. M361]